MQLRLEDYMGERHPLKFKDIPREFAPYETGIKFLKDVAFGALLVLDTETMTIEVCWDFQSGTSSDSPGFRFGSDEQHSDLPLEALIYAYPKEHLTSRLGSGIRDMANAVVAARRKTERRALADRIARWSGFMEYLNRYAPISDGK